jgi:prevent-host-death family protein
MDVGGREFKQRLSEYLDRASRGETIRVTDRGQPKAILGPVPGAARLDQGAAEGWIRAAQDTPAVAVRRVRADRRSEDVLRDDRDDR